MIKPSPDSEIKLVVTDLDNTALLPDKSVSPRVAAAFRACRQKGIHTAVATARAYSRNASFLDELGVDCAVVNDGTVVYRDGEIVYDAPLSDETTYGILDEIINAGQLHDITILTEKEFYWNRVTEAAEQPAYHYFVDFTKPFRLDVPVYKLLARMTDKAVAREIAEKFACRLQCYRDEPFYAFVSKDSGKMLGIRRLCDALGIGVENVAAFGDDLNDIEMLSACGQGIAMANAIDEAKAAADFIALSNAEDGVADYIEKHFLV